MKPRVDKTAPPRSETVTSHPFWSRTPLHLGFGPLLASAEDVLSTASLPSCFVLLSRSLVSPPFCDFSGSFSNNNSCILTPLTTLPSHCSMTLVNAWHNARGPPMGYAIPSSLSIPHKCETCAAILVWSGDRFSLGMPMAAINDRTCVLRGKHLFRNADTGRIDACWYTFESDDPVLANSFDR